MKKKLLSAIFLILCVLLLPISCSKKSTDTSSGTKSIDDCIIDTSSAGEQSLFEESTESDALSFALTLSDILSSELKTTCEAVDTSSDDLIIYEICTADISQLRFSMVDSDNDSYSDTITIYDCETGNSPYEKVFFTAAGQILDAMYFNGNQESAFINMYKSSVNNYISGEDSGGASYQKLLSTTERYLVFDSSFNIEYTVCLPGHYLSYDNIENSSDDISSENESDTATEYIALPSKLLAFTSSASNIYSDELLSSVTNKLERGIPVALLGTVNDLYRIDYLYEGSFKSGYIFADNVSTSVPDYETFDGFCSSREAQKIRLLPKGNTSLGTVPSGEKIKIIGEYESYYLIEYSNSTSTVRGYIDKAYVSKSSDTADISIVGTWTANDENYRSVFTFNSDGTFSCGQFTAFSDNNYDGYNGEDTGLYKIQGSEITLTYSSVGATETLPFTLTATTLNLTVEINENIQAQYTRS